MQPSSKTRKPSIDNQLHCTRSACVQSLEPRQLLAAGTLDNSFGTDGMAAVDFGDGYVGTAAAVAVQADGKSVVVGSVTRGTGSSKVTHFAIARFTIDGKLDTSFGANRNGRIISAAGGRNSAQLSAVAIQPDGKIIVAGDAFTAITLGFDSNRFVVNRLLPNGSFDKSFGTFGFTDIDFGDDGGHASDIALQNDGKIIIAGWEYKFTKPYSDFAICRLLPNGKLDTTFSGDGKREVNLGGSSATTDVGTAVAIDYSGTKATNPNYGKIVMAGRRYSADDLSRAAVVRFTTTGNLDNTFDRDGKVLTSLPGNLSLNANDVLIQPDGKIVIAGTGDGSSPDFALQRFLTDGSADDSFGADGNSFVIADFGTTSGADGIFRNDDGSLVVAGRANGQFAIAKFSANGLPDATFGNGGKVRTAFGSEIGYGLGVGYGPGRRFVLAGGLGFGTARYLDTGANIVTIGTLNPQASEAGPKGTAFVVGRPERLPTPLRVYLNASGTARAPGTVLGATGRDYTGTDISFGNGLTSSTYVDIPANQTFTTVAITPVDDSIIEGKETATFSILPNPAYEPDIHSSVSIFIADNDGTVLAPTADASVQNGAAFTRKNFGSDKELRVKQGGSGTNRRAYVKFDLSTVTTITSARLRLFGRLNGGTTPITTAVYSVADTGWTEGSLTWTTRRTQGAAPLATTTITDTTLRLYEWDVTAYLQAQKAAGKTVVSFVLINPVQTAQFVVFNSREAASARPQLIVGA